MDEINVHTQLFLELPATLLEEVEIQAKRFNVDPGTIVEQALIQWLLNPSINVGFSRQIPT